MLNAQFSSVFTREDRFNVPTMTTSPHPKMTPIRVGSQGVLKLLQQLNTRKASGGDDIPAILLKNCASELCSMLTFIYQHTIEKKCVPRDWKQALLTPIFKKGNRSCPANYRPVSLTSICCKICEHIIVSQTMRHLDAHSNLVDQQHGFRHRRSCETQLIITTHDLAELLNQKTQADMAVLDFWHSASPQHFRKLRHYDIDSNVIGWIASFLSNKTQKVVVDGYESSGAPVLSGVPQGTLLGPLLFLIFINDISANLSSTIRLFTDDCLVYREIKSTTDCDALQEDLNKLVVWSHTWGMEFNVAKCNILTVTNKVKHQVKYRYRMEGEAVKLVSFMPCPGVTVNSKLTWNKHIDGIISSANRLLGFLWRNMHRCPPTLKERAYTAMIRPKLEYCSSVWDPCRQKHVNQL